MNVKQTLMYSIACIEFKLLNSIYNKCKRSSYKKLLQAVATNFLRQFNVTHQLTAHRGCWRNVSVCPCSPKSAPLEQLGIGTPIPQLIPSTSSEPPVNSVLPLDNPPRPLPASTSVSRDRMDHRELSVYIYTSILYILYGHQQLIAHFILANTRIQFSKAGWNTMWTMKSGRKILNFARKG